MSSSDYPEFVLHYNRNVEDSCVVERPYQVTSKAYRPTPHTFTRESAMSTDESTAWLVYPPRTETEHVKSQASFHLNKTEQIMQSCNVSRDRAAKALKRYNGDMFMATMSLK